MRLIRTLGAVALLATAAIALAIPSTAGAEYTALCKVNESPCAEGNLATSIHAELRAGTIALLDTNEADILCLKVLSQVAVGEPGAPQELELTALTFNGCGTEGAGGSHSNCTVVSTATTKTPIHLSVLHTAPNLGQLEATDGTVKVKCTVFGFIKFECEYVGEGLTFHVEGAIGGRHGALSAGNTSLETIGGGLCPETSEISAGTLEPLEDVYLTAEEEPEEGSALCAAHEEPCSAGNLVASVHMELTGGTIALLHTSTADILCLTALAQGTVEKLWVYQEIAVTDLRFESCGTEGSGGSHSNCVIRTNTEAEPPIHLVLSRTALNSGSLESFNGEVAVKCTVFGVLKIECTYASEGLTFPVEGAAEGNHGMLSMAKTALEKTVGGSLCPETSEIATGLLEPLENTYLVQ